MITVGANIVSNKEGADTMQYVQRLLKSWVHAEFKSKASPG